MEKQAISEPYYNIVEIFESLQGEGFNTGMPAIFIRFGKCNLACPWCDTNYHQFKRWSLSQILNKVRSFSAKNIIITGGEPTIVPKLPLVQNVYMRINTKSVVFHLHTKFVLLLMTILFLFVK